ncbi:hypothetical protein O4160_09050 [Rhodococcus sp. IEGM 1401]|uniref:Lipoprotein n=1 Tax=Rhodococcus cerastii TaxID=908616 RepID=A0ABU4CXG2_9NOCA|nr:MULTISPECIES: hypothetical protein [Rhodococcus]MCZ4560987.1 hypothetical protein [Rhodococcus sp. IEGM 1401]MDI9921107.1 hypothetical protein [Rhodococcus sp. IEGM 1372]MDI9925693.1 hypothetical protein [Rhodococcus sp. IEGM 1341]MDV6302150.1 hypothetical protein [Rhodococcus cerastii]MDV8033560.1 hypothetical protein [Rhodococcus sp. IEGM 1414]
MHRKARLTVFAAGAVAALGLVTGCSSSDEAATGQNTDACNTFAADHNTFVGLVTAGPGSAANIEKWTADKQAAVDALKSVPGTASGDVASASTTFVEALPDDTLELSETDSASGKAFVDNGAAVKSACEADGTTITLDALPLTTFTN